MYEAIFRVIDGGWFTEATVDADVGVTLWCNEYCDLLYVVGGDADAFVAEIAPELGIRDETDRGTGHLVVTETCLKDHTDRNIEQYLVRHNCLLLPPLRYADGEKRVRLLALDPDDLTQVYRDLVGEGHDVVVDRKRELTMLRQQRPLLTLEEVLPDLTGRQQEALVEAYERDYYDVPRGTTTSEIADAMGVERRTAEEHLHRAEQKLADALVPYLRS